MLRIVIPAHNEAQVIGRLLGQLVATAEEGEFDILVVANGCNDNTAEVAAAFGPPVRVLSVPVASKREALAAGNRAANGFPRFYVDADVELRAEDVRELGQALQRPGVLAVSPERTLAMTGRRWPIRWYYDVWARLPEVEQGLFGRGVIGVSEAGYARVAAMGVNEIERTEDAPDSTARTRPADLVRMASRDVRLAPRVALFLGVALLARARARRVAARHHDSEWLRAESSRTGPAVDGDQRHANGKYSTIR